MSLQQIHTQTVFTSQIIESHNNKKSFVNSPNFINLFPKNKPRFPFISGIEKITTTKCFLVKLNEAILSPADMKFMNSMKESRKRRHDSFT